MQLLKYLQAQGLGSRKICTQLIKHERIHINGTLQTDPKGSVPVTAIESVWLDDAPLPVVPLPFFYILLNKPADTETSHKPTHYPSVFSLFPSHFRNIDLQAIGRLDADTTGLLLITNDGNYNHRVTSPKHKVPKIYQVTLKHAADADWTSQLTDGVLLHDENETVRAHSAYLEDATTLIMTITEGKYHQVKRMIAAAGNRVEALHRRTFGEFELGNLAAGEWQFVTPTEYTDLP